MEFKVCYPAMREKGQLLCQKSKPDAKKKRSKKEPWKREEKGETRNENEEMLRECMKKEEKGPENV